MRELTKEMIKYYNLKKLKIDFMGYEFNRYQDLSFHHLIIPHRMCKELGFGEGYLWWNGSILNQKQDSSHPYLHIVEAKDYDMFLAITSEMIDEVIKGYLDMQNLYRIDDILCCFEREHCSDETKKGKPLIKEGFTRRLVRRK